MMGFISLVIVLSSFAAINSFSQNPLRRSYVSNLLSMQTDHSCRCGSSSSNHHHHTHSPPKPVIIELIARKEISSGKRTQSGKEVGRKKLSGLKSRATAGVYKEKGDTIMEKLVDSPVSTLASFLLNPTTLVLVVYLSSVAWGQVSWLQVCLLHTHDDDRNY